MKPWRTVLLVMGRELRARRRATLIVTAGLVATAVAAFAILQALSSDGGRPASLTTDEADQLLGFIGVVVLFMAIVLTGQIILLGVAEEKNSRVAEVVLGAMAPRHLLLGKIVAIGLIGLFEVLLTGGSVLALGGALDRFELPRATAGGVAIVLMWFVLGFVFYSTVYAAAGALVARHQNAANAAGPINIVLMMGYLVGVASASGSADNIALRIASLLPPLAPVTMPLRMIRDVVPLWEVMLAVLLVIIGGYGLILLGERIYSGGLLRGGKVGWREAWRSTTTRS